MKQVEKMLLEARTQKRLEGVAWPDQLIRSWDKLGD